MLDPGAENSEPFVGTVLYMYNNKETFMAMSVGLLLELILFLEKLEIQQNFSILILAMISLY